MTSSAATSNILKSDSRQYNMNKAGYAALFAVAKYRSIKERQKNEFAKSNKKVIDNALKAGPKKIEKDFVDYKATETAAVPMTVVVIAGLLTLIAIFFLLNCSQITKYNNEINSLKTQITQYEAERAELVISLDKKIDLARVEQYAKENGMVKTEKLPVMYLDMTTDYKIERISEPETEFAVSTVMSGVAQLFKEAFN